MAEANVEYRLMTVDDIPGSTGEEVFHHSMVRSIFVSELTRNDSHLCRGPSG